MPVSERNEGSEDKLRQLILYISRISEGDERFGSVKLNKLLFFADVAAYRRMGRTITGTDYRRRDNGPCPSRMKRLLDEMVERSELAIVTRPYHGFSQLRPIALKEPILALFGGEEIDIVNAIVRECWGKSAREVGDISHETLGWKLACDGEFIPMEVSLIEGVLQVSESQRAWAATFEQEAALTFKE